MLSYRFKEMDHNLLVSLDGLNLKVWKEYDLSSG